MAWVYLFVAGVLEIVWAVGLKYTEGFTRPLASIITIAAMVVSMGLLGLAVRTLPIGTSYAVWTGIGIVGTTLFGIWFLQESASPIRLVFIALVIIGIIGLKVTVSNGSGAH